MYCKSCQQNVSSREYCHETKEGKDQCPNFVFGRVDALDRMERFVVRKGTLLGYSYLHKVSGDEFTWGRRNKASYFSFAEAYQLAEKFKAEVADFIEL